MTHLHFDVLRRRLLTMIRPNLSVHCLSPAFCVVVVFGVRLITVNVVLKIKGKDVA